MGNGMSIDIWRERWGIERLSGASISMDKSQVPEVHVSELFNADMECFNAVRVTEIYDECLKDQICNLPISHADHADQRVWFHNPCGGLDNRLLDKNFTHCIDWLEEGMRLLNRTAMADLITVMGNNWNSRKNKVFQGVEDDARVV
ncbi:reverse transcriptase [Gossypium australe]|uniref:Reverse transcriptase n=1 Tax=Gossypium australe TaxID=47621 RepID=A0A5B6VGA4_9ROSI|nr:reverse transcriptase [Gossypium australe]